MKNSAYQCLALGGTFDHLHIGHEKFLTFASDLAEHLIIGLTNQEMALTKPYPNATQTYDQRRETLLEFLKTHQIPHKIITLHDIFGTTLQDQSIQALTVTTETQTGAKLINQARIKKHLPPLPIHVCQLAIDELGQPIHSARIRSGEISRRGIVYNRIFTKSLVLSSDQLLKLKKFRAELVTKITSPTDQLVAIVGDATLTRFISAKQPFDIGIFDHQTKRHEYNKNESLNPGYLVTNQAGEITPQLISTIREVTQRLSQPTLRSPQLIEVNGEEDLTTVALALNLPLGSLIYYGQPDEGLMKLEVTERIKDDFYQILVN